MIHLQHRLPRRRAFTFLEIMFVVVIIGILLALVGPRLVGRTQKARISATEAQLRNTETAIKAYEMDLGKFPESLEDLIEDPGEDDWDGPYLDSDEIPADAWGNEFVYKAPGEYNRRGFDLYSLGPNEEDDNGEKAEGDDAAGGPDDIANFKVR